MRQSLAIPRRIERASSCERQSRCRAVLSVRFDLLREIMRVEQRPRNSRVDSLSRRDRASFCRPIVCKGFGFCSVKGSCACQPAAQHHGGRRKVIPEWVIVFHPGAHGLQERLLHQTDQVRLMRGRKRNFVALAGCSGTRLAIMPKILICAAPIKSRRREADRPAVCPSSKLDVMRCNLRQQRIPPSRAPLRQRRQIVGDRPRAV